MGSREDIEKATWLGAQAGGALELSAVPSREQLRAARALYLEALGRLDAGAPTSAPRTRIKDLARALERRLARERRAVFWARLREHRRRLVTAARVAAGLLAVWLGVSVWQSRFHRDLLAGRAFTTSSTWARCEPEKGRCAGAPTHIAFHTNEEPDPFVIYDLGRESWLGRVEVTNRRDNNLGMRAVPLSVQVSVDGVTFREIARRDYWFDVWRADVGKTRARYLKLTVPRRTILHLERVRAWE